MRAGGGRQNKNGESEDRAEVRRAMGSLRVAFAAAALSCGFIGPGCGN